MKKVGFTMLKTLILCAFLCLTHLGFAAIEVGLSQKEITPPIGTPSAGYVAREGKGMTGVHDPLFATALVVKSDGQTLVLCSVDHLGFLYNMTHEIRRRLASVASLEGSTLLLGSTHTHSGGGAFLNIPGIGEKISGPFDPNILEFYIEQTTQTIIEASQNLKPAKIGIGYGNAAHLCTFRSSYPPNRKPLGDLTVIKVTDLKDRPIAALYNIAIHPVILGWSNTLFSADLIGGVRDGLEHSFGPGFASLFFNGAQADINPSDEWRNSAPFENCAGIGQALANEVIRTWDTTDTEETLTIETARTTYDVMKTANKAVLPLQHYPTEINLITLNRSHAFVSIPGELSSVYDEAIQNRGKSYGFAHVSIFGLTNDAHGYIITPEAFRAGTAEVRKAFGGEDYGPKVEKMVIDLLKTKAPLPICGND